MNTESNIQPLVPVAPLLPLPPDQALTVSLGDIYDQYGYQKEVMEEELYRVRKNIIDTYTREQASSEVTRFLGDDQTKIDARRRLLESRESPYVSKETQMAVLKGMIMDYEAGLRRPGLNAMTVMKAVELLNKMTGYEKPVETKVTHEHMIVNTFPVSAEPFKGHLEPLDVIDVPDYDGKTTVAITKEHKEQQTLEKQQAQEAQEIKVENHIEKTHDKNDKITSTPPTTPDKAELDPSGLW